MNPAFFYALSLVLTADGLMTFLTPVVVYQITGSVEYSGLSYAIWWLPRLTLIPLLGRLIDRLGVRPLSIVSDCVKVAGCLSLTLFQLDNPLETAIGFGLVGSLISIGNSQTMIAYEKIIALLSTRKSHDVNVLSRLDFIGMIVGPTVGLLFIDFGYKLLLLVPCLFYLINAAFFLCVRLGDVGKESTTVRVLDALKRNYNGVSFRFILCTPVLPCLIGLSAGNNMFDGLVESSGAAIVERSMNLPIKYFSLVDIAAGVCGVWGTYIFGALSRRTDRLLITIMGLLLIIIPSVALIAFPNLLSVFVACYALSIIGKVFTGNIGRLLRIEVIPMSIYASTSSLVVLLGQAILPAVGIALFLLGSKAGMLTLLLSTAVLLSTACGLLLLKTLTRTQAQNGLRMTEVQK